MNEHRPGALTGWKSKNPAPTGNINYVGVLSEKERSGESFVSFLFLINEYHPDAFTGHHPSALTGYHSEFFPGRHPGFFPGHQ
jgi:hypothetical protein